MAERRAEVHHPSRPGKQEADLVDLFTADEVLRVQVIEHSRVLFERTPADRAHF